MEMEIRPHLEQQVSLGEADPVDGGDLRGGRRRDGGGGGRSERVAAEHQAPLAAPVGAVLAFLYGGWRRENHRRRSLVSF